MATLRNNLRVATNIVCVVLVSWVCAVVPRARASHSVGGKQEQQALTAAVSVSANVLSYFHGVEALWPFFGCRFAFAFGMRSKEQLVSTH